MIHFQNIFVQLTNKQKRYQSWQKQRFDEIERSFFFINIRRTLLSKNINLEQLDKGIFCKNLKIKCTSTLTLIQTKVLSLKQSKSITSPNFRILITLTKDSQLIAQQYTLWKSNGKVHVRSWTIKIDVIMKIASLSKRSTIRVSWPAP